MSLFATWWVWLAGAAVLAVLEMLAPAYVFLGFAVGAALVGVLLGVGGSAAEALAGSLPLTLVVFAALSLIAWILLRLAFGPAGGSVRTFDHDINED